MHAAEGRMNRASETRFREAVEAVRLGYLIARNKKALTAWQRWRPKGSKRQVGLTGKALERAMSGIIALHPELLKGASRPFHLQPNSLRKPSERLKVARRTANGATAAVKGKG